MTFTLGVHEESVPETGPRRQRGLAVAETAGPTKPELSLGRSPDPCCTSESPGDRTARCSGHASDQVTQTGWRWGPSSVF